ncbi:MAG TPA: phosphoribosylanthranilate isomerase [Thermoanaerobaculia bacterium]|nr:phosphoribosylanthranilate isomerase [Thermoanaerobaculia bacterium]
MREEILELPCGAGPREGLKSLATHERPWRDGGGIPPPTRRDPSTPPSSLRSSGSGRDDSGCSGARRSAVIPSGGPEARSRGISWAGGGPPPPSRQGRSWVARDFNPSGTRRPASLPLIKICGVTTVEDALLAAQRGASHLGLNFFPPSPRCLEPAAAREIAEAVRGRVALVGVFVDRPRAEVEAIDAAVSLDLLQFHGAETPEDLAPFGARAIKVFRLRPEDPLPDLAAFPAAWGFLFDVWHPALHGGTGEGWDFSRLAALPRGRPVLVAGGIRPGNVAAALAASGAAGVDVCSGVESAPGKKDPELLAQLFREVHHYAGIA